MIALGVAVVMTFLATRRRFGRYVYSIGGNPDAAELAGINTKFTVMKTFITMGILAALAAAVISARLNAATVGLGTGAELQVIAAAVIGGTSFAGGIGTIPGAVLGAVDHAVAPVRHGPAEGRLGDAGRRRRRRPGQRRGARHHPSTSVDLGTGDEDDDSKR